MRIRGEESDAVRGDSGDGRNRKCHASDPPAFRPQKHAADERKLESEKDGAHHRKDREPARVGSTEQALGARDEGVGKLALSDFQGDARGPDDRHQQAGRSGGDRPPGWRGSRVGAGRARQGVSFAGGTRRAGKRLDAASATAAIAIAAQQP